MSIVFVLFFEKKRTKIKSVQKQQKTGQNLAVDPSVLDVSIILGGKEGCNMGCGLGYAASFATGGLTGLGAYAATQALKKNK